MRTPQYFLYLSLYCRLSPALARIVLCLIRMADLPIDPAEMPGTTEYEELQDERRARIRRAQWAAYEDEHDRHFCRHA